MRGAERDRRGGRVESELRAALRPEGVHRAQLRQRGDEGVERIDRAGRRGPVVELPAARRTRGSHLMVAGAELDRPHRCGAHAQHARPAHGFEARAPRRRLDDEQQRRRRRARGPARSSVRRRAHPMRRRTVVTSDPREQHEPRHHARDRGEQAARLLLGQHQRGQRALHLRDVLRALAHQLRLAARPRDGVERDVAIAEHVEVRVAREVGVADDDQPAARASPSPPPTSAITMTDSGPGTSCAAFDGSSPRRARPASAIAHAEGAVRAMLSAATPGTSRDHVHRARRRQHHAALDRILRRLRDRVAADGTARPPRRARRWRAPGARGRRRSRRRARCPCVPRNACRLGSVPGSRSSSRPPPAFRWVASFSSSSGRKSRFGPATITRSVSAGSGASSRLTTSTVMPCASSPAMKRPMPCGSPVGTRSPCPVVRTARRRCPRSASRMPPASCSSDSAGTITRRPWYSISGAPVLRHAVAARALGVAVEVEQLDADPGVLGAQALHQAGEDRALAAAVNTVTCSGSVTCASDLARDGRQRERPGRCQVDAPVRALREHLEEDARQHDQDRLQHELRPAAQRPSRRHQRSPRQRRESSASSVNARNAAANRTR